MLLQVDLICQRIVKEHDIRTRESFDHVLNNKLAGMNHHSDCWILPGG